MQTESKSTFTNLPSSGQLSIVDSEYAEQENLTDIALSFWSYYKKPPTESEQKVMEKAVNNVLISVGEHILERTGRPIEKIVYAVIRGYALISEKELITKLNFHSDPQILRESCNFIINIFAQNLVHPPACLFKIREEWRGFIESTPSVVFPPEFKDVTETYLEIFQFKKKFAHFYEIAATGWRRPANPHLELAIFVVLYAARLKLHEDQDPAMEIVPAIIATFSTLNGNLLSEQEYYDQIVYGTNDLVITASLYILDILRECKLTPPLGIPFLLAKLGWMKKNDYEYVRLNGMKIERATESEWDLMPYIPISPEGHLKDYPLPTLSESLELLPSKLIIPKLQPSSKPKPKQLNKSSWEKALGLKIAGKLTCRGKSILFHVPASAQLGDSKEESKLTQVALIPGLPS